MVDQVMNSEDTLHELALAIGSAADTDRALLDVAIVAWERLTGSRKGLNSALLELADGGVIQCQTWASSTGDRKVLRISSGATSGLLKQRIPTNRKVFVVHGRDEILRQSMFSFLRSINLHPLEWRELVTATGTGSPYVAEVLNRAFDLAQAVVVLLTPDEEVCLVERLGGGEEGLQARPNVIFEAGLALARNPNRTIIAEIGVLRPISDLAGKHVVRLDDAASDAVGRRQDLAQRLAAAGCDVSLLGTDWHSVGSFRSSAESGSRRSL